MRLPRIPRVLPSLVVLSLALTLSACSASGPDDRTASSGSPAGGTAGSPEGGSGQAGAPAVSVGRVLATGLQVPWGITFLGDGSALVGERPTGRVVRVGATGGVTPVGTVPGVADQGEGGLLGLAFRPAEATSPSASRSASPSASRSASPATSPAASPAGQTGSTGTVFAYMTATVGDNRVISMTWDGQQLGTPVTLLKGIRSARNHNGGALVIGPDGKLWIGTGDATDGRNSQNRASLNGKILRLNLDGTRPADNPFPDSLVYSLGHRNVQGISFDSRNQPWAVEFGQNTWDELNRIRPGGNYGWPMLEGKAGRSGYLDPLVQWPTDEASPSGLTILRDVAYAGGLRGQRLWQVPLPATSAATAPAGAPRAWLQGDLGRIRTVATSPGGTLWITTSNRDGRGSPRQGDDKVIQLSLR